MLNAIIIPFGRGFGRAALHAREQVAWRVLTVPLLEFWAVSLPAAVIKGREKLIAVSETCYYLSTPTNG